MIFTLISFTKSIVDRYGVIFEDDEFTIITKCQSSLEIYEVPSTTRRIKSGTELENAFGSHCKNLKNVTFQSDSELVEIGSYSFYQSKIAFLNLSCCSKLDRILNNAFQYCSLLSYLELPDSITQIQESGLYGIAVRRLRIPKSLLKLQYYSIAHCTSLASIEFHPNCSLLEIESESFKNSGLTEIKIPNSVTKLANGFIHCPIQTIEIGEENNNYIVENNIVYSKDFSVLIFSAFYPGNIKVHPHTKTISTNAFRGCRPISIEMHENITMVESWAFSGMNITYISLPSSVSSIANSCFAYSALITLDMNCSITTIPTSLFCYSRSLKRVIVPSKVRTIDSNAFLECTALEYLFVPASVTTISSGAFSMMNASCVIEIESSSTIKLIGRSMYSSDLKTFSNYIGENDVKLEVIEGAETIGSRSCQSRSFSEIVLPSTVKTIESYSFTGLKIFKTLNLTFVESIGEGAFRVANFSEIILGPNLRQISSLAFQECANLKRVDVPLMVASIGERAFDGCLSLSTLNFDFDSDDSPFDYKLESISQLAFRQIAAKSVELPPSLTALGYKVFSDSSVKSVSFHSNSKMTELDSFAFADMRCLTDFQFPKRCISIGESCFAGDTALAEVILRDSVRNISSLAFSGCASLRTVELGDDSELEVIEPLVFEGCVSLVSFTVSDSNNHFSADEGVLFDKDRTRIVVFLPASEIATFVVPASVLEIGPYGFYGAAHLENITMEDGCTRIGFEAFRGCSALRYIRLSSGIASVGANAFADCPSLGCDSVVFPGGFDISLLDESRLPSDAYQHCPTQYFTHLGKRANATLLSAFFVGTLVEEYIVLIFS